MRARNLRSANAGTSTIGKRPGVAEPGRSVGLSNGSERIKAEIKTGIGSLAYVEQVYATYRRDPTLVTADWRGYFAAAGPGHAEGKVQLGPSFKQRSVFNPAS